MRRLTIVFLGVFLALPLMALEPAEGRWDGSIVLPAMKLAVQVDLERTPAGWDGDITIPAQQARDLSLVSITVAGASVSFRIDGVPGDPTFTGTLEGDTLAGSFTQAGQTFPFSLKRGSRDDAAAVLAGIDELMSGALKSWDVQGLALAVVGDGKIVYAKGFGTRDAGKSLPMTADTLLPIGSITKSVTTTVMGMLVDEGRLVWDDPVRNYLPAFRGPDEHLTAHLTVRDLVTHRSGLPRHDLVWYNNQDPTRREIVGRLAHLPPNEKLRAKWQYNNLMFLTAGVLVEQLTGTTWEEAVRTRVLTPLGMTRTTFADADSAKDGDHARPYRERDGKNTEIPFREVGNMGPAGSINSSVNEMARYALLHLQKGSYAGAKLVQPSTMDELHAPLVAVGTVPEYVDISPGAYGMGWFVDSYRAHTRVHHGGAIDGFSALLTLFPNDGIAVIALANADGSALPAVITSHVADLLLKLEARDWNGLLLAQRTAGRALTKEAEKKKTVTRRAGTKPSHSLADYAGVYEHPGYGVVRVDHLGTDRLQATYNYIVTSLEHWHYDVFNGLRNEKDPTFENMKYLFRGDLAGNVAELEVPFEPFVAPIVFRKRPDAKLTDPTHLAQFLGDYALGPQTISISLRGTKLVATLAGQPPYPLTARIDGWFDLDGITGFRLRFVGETMELSQPNGLFTANRKK